MVSFRVVARGLLIALVLGAAAPSPCAADVEEARALFEQGSAALASGRFPEGRDLLRRSLDAHPRPATAFNLVVALRGTDEPTEAARVCDGLLGGRYGALDAEGMRQARAVCDEVARARGRIEVVASGAPRIALRVDERSLGEVDDGGSIARFVDPGWHVVRAAAPGRAPAERSLHVERGGVVRAALSLAPSGSDDALAWGVGLGSAAAVLVGVAIAIAAAVLAPGSPAYDLHLEI